MTIGQVDVLVLAALKEELDALLEVKDGVREAWARVEGDPPLHVAVLDGAKGPLRVAAARQTKMAGVTTASLAARLIERLDPKCIAMCGVCAGHPEDTDLGDVVIAERLFQHDEGKIRHDGFQGDLWVDALRDDWLRVAQDMVGPGASFSLYEPPASEDWKWWFLERLSAGRDPLRSCALRRYVPDEVRAARFQALKTERLVTWKGKIVELTKAGSRAVEEHQLLHGTLVRTLPFHVHVGPIGSGNAVQAGGETWRSLAEGGERKVLAVEMEAAAIGRVAHERGLRFAVAKGVMDHADRSKSDRFKSFAARASAAVLCEFLRRVVEPSVTATTADGDALRTPRVFISYSHGSKAHYERVTALADQLCLEGVDAWIDRYVATPAEGWPRWLRTQLVHADAVLVVCDSTYRRRFEGDAGGGGWEKIVSSALSYGDPSRKGRFIPVLLGSASADDIPAKLRSAIPYRLPDEFSELLRRLRGGAAGAGSDVKSEEVSRTRRRKVAERKTESPATSALKRTVQSDGVPMVVEEVASPNTALELPGDAMRALQEFLIKTFAAWELRQVAFLYGGDNLAASLPGESAPLAELAWQMVMALWHRGLLDGGFFRVLEAERGRLATQIRELQRRFVPSALSPTTTASQRAARAPKAASESVEASPAAKPVPAHEQAAAKGKTRAKKAEGAAAESRAARPDAECWTAKEMEGRLADVLKSSDKLTRSLDRRLESGKAKAGAKRTAEDDVVARVAQRILALGTGFRAAYRLVDACFEAVLGKNKDAESERSVARELVCEWLPFAYPEVADVVLLRVKRQPPDPRNVEMTAAHEYFVEVHMARIDGRRCKFTTTRSDSRGGRVFAESMVPMPPGSSERQSTEEIVELLVSVVRECFPTKTTVKSRVALEKKKGRTPYLVIPGAQRLRDEVIRRLNRDLPDLHVVVLAERPEGEVPEDEGMLWGMLEDLFK